MKNSCVLAIFLLIFSSSCKKENSKLEKLQGTWKRIPVYGINKLEKLEIKKNKLIYSDKIKSKFTKIIKSFQFEETIDYYSYKMNLFDNYGLYKVKANDETIFLNKTKDTLKFNNQQYVKN